MLKSRPPALCTRGLVCPACRTAILAGRHDEPLRRIDG